MFNSEEIYGSLQFRGNGTYTQQKSPYNFTIIWGV